MTPTPTPKTTTAALTGERSEATPRPWSVSVRQTIEGLHDHRIAVVAVTDCDGFIPDANQQANAALIVCAVNSHDALVKALLKIRELTEPGQTVGVEGQTVGVEIATDIICDVWNEARAALKLSGAA